MYYFQIPTQLLGGAPGTTSKNHHVYYDELLSLFSMGRFLSINCLCNLSFRDDYHYFR